MDLDFTGKTVLVVGGSSGIGNGVAHGFRQRGAQVHVWGTRPSAADYDGIEGSDLEGLGYAKVDVGGREVQSRGAELAPAGWARVMAVNLDSLMDCARKFGSTLAARKGVIIIVSSVSGYTSNRGNPAYAASKAGAVSLTKTLGEAG